MVSLDENHDQSRLPPILESGGLVSDSYQNSKFDSDTKDISNNELVNGKHRSTIDSELYYVGEDMSGLNYKKEDCLKCPIKVLHLESI